jgi:hypothetical protein
VAAAVAAKNRAALDTQREQLKAKLDEGKVKARSEAAAAKQETQAWWTKVRSDINDRLTEMRAKRDEHRTEHDVRHAEHRAEDAELDATDAIYFAEWAIDQAEYAVTDAAGNADPPEWTQVNARYRSSQ